MPKSSNRTTRIKFLLREAMSRRRIETQKELASYTHLSESDLSNRINRKVHWSVEDLRSIDKALHFTNDELIEFVRYAF